MNDLQWRKSSRSDDTGGACVEVARWRKSRRSTDTGGDCVEVAGLEAAIAVRDSKDPDRGKLVLGFVQWRAFVRRVKDGAYGG